MSFDLSTTNILLASAVAALFIAFIFVLMKLKPTTEDKQNQEPRTNVDREKPQPLQAPQPLRTLPPSSKSAESSSVSSKAPTSIQARKALPAQNQVKPSVPTSLRTENREVLKQNKTVQTPAKPELTPTGKDCIHFYGYLHSLPKNTPIPDECFGCVKIVDCLISPDSNSSSSLNSNSNHNSKKRGWL